MDPLTAVVAAGSLVLAGIASAVACLLLGRSLEARAGGAELGLERDRRERSDALAAERGQMLSAAQERIVARARAAQDDADAARALDAAVLGAPPGDELAAVERLLRADAAARRATQAGAPGEGGRPAGDAGGAAAVGGGEPGIPARA